MLTRVLALLTLELLTPAREVVRPPREVREVVTPPREVVRPSREAREVVTPPREAREVVTPPREVVTLPREVATPRLPAVRWARLLLQWTLFLKCGTILARLFYPYVAVWHKKL
jgi:hypothetical protein